MLDNGIHQLNITKLSRLSENEGCCWLKTK